MQKVAWVIGASGGIGRAVSLELATEGYSVIIGFSSHEEKAIQLEKEIASKKGNAKAVFSDVSSSQNVQEAYRKICQLYGTPDVLVYSAGLADSRLFQDMDDESYRRLMNINLDGAFRAAREVLPEMIRNRHGIIILISSMWGQIGGSCEVVYSMAKAGLIGLTKALAKEVAPSGVRVNCVAPGVILTDMVSPLGEETLNELAKETPLGRNGLPEDVASAVRYLASADSSFVTGQVLGVNGGLVI